MNKPRFTKLEAEKAGQLLASLRESQSTPQDIKDQESLQELHQLFKKLSLAETDNVGDDASLEDRLFGSFMRQRGTREDAEDSLHQSFAEISDRINDLIENGDSIPILEFVILEAVLCEIQHGYNTHRIEEAFSRS
jgi:hypothetical protein